MDDLATWLTRIWDEREDDFEKACEAEAEALCHDGMPGTTAEDIREFWLKPESESGWRLRLARIAADRQILAEHRPSKPARRTMMERGCLVCATAQAWDPKANEANCLTMRLLAQPYASRPGFRDEWLVAT